MASKRDYYNKLFENYPDVVNTKQFREMLGGINEKTAITLRIAERMISCLSPSAAATPNSAATFGLR